MQKVLQIIYISIRKLLAKKTLYAMLFILLLIVGLMGSQLFGIMSGSDEASLAQKASVLAEMIGVWAEFSVYLVIIYSAAAIYNDLKTKSILGVLAKPVTRRQFLLGRWLGVVVFFSAFVLTGALTVFVLMAIWNISITPLLIVGIIHKLGVLFAYSSIAFVLSLFVPAIVGGGITFMLFIFRSLFQQMSESSINTVEYLGYIFYYMIPAVSSDEMIKNGILDNMLDPAFTSYLSIIAENVLYGAILFFAGTLFYKLKDILFN